MSASRLILDKGGVSSPVEGCLVRMRANESDVQNLNGSHEQGQSSILET